MDRFAIWPREEKEELFLDSAERLPHLPPSLIEKDFWVCWMLRRLFLLDHGVKMIFKGGTSISKAYPIIRRFSEDIDLSLDREGLGFEKDELEAAPSKTAFRALLEDLQTACVNHVTGPLLEALRDAVASILGPNRNDGAEVAWDLSPREDGQSLVFMYPRTAVTLQRGGYVAPDILLEFGARGDHWPADDRVVSAYAAQAVPDAFEVGGFTARTLDVTRTFWEKATILHSLAHGGPSKVRPRMARHYYDLAMLADAPESANSVGKTDLLEAVALHKGLFFAAAWASYDTARVGSLRLVPPPEVRDMVEKDYSSMAALFMEEPPPFDALMERLDALESGING
jgi:nucleotidyltransferase AbiEii toxin of type IV toxin-antitoxin system